MSSPSPVEPEPPRGGLPFAIGAYAIWGFLPVYIKLLSALSAFEVLAHRILWSVPVTLVILVWRGQWREYRAGMADRRSLQTMLLSSALISANWGVYMWAVMNGHILATSLGYYLNPLVNVLLGRLVLGEALNRTQGIAVGIAGVAVAIMLASEPAAIWISFTLALSFGSYGLVRKMATVGAVPGLAMEVTLLSPIALIALIGWAGTNDGFGSTSSTSLLLMASGVVTAIPLLLFATAARRMSYTALGFVQYFSPTIVFFLSIFVYHEPLDTVKLGCFVLIWMAIAVFSVDALRRMRQARMVAV